MGVPAANPETTFFDLSPEAARESVEALGGRRFHADVIRREATARGVLDYGAMTALPLRLRDRLAVELPLLRSREVAQRRAPDGTVKSLLRLGDGETVECVFMPARRTRRGATLCVSTQVGCPVGCPFCASGKAGLVRNLTAGEIYEQVLRAASLGPIARLVVMGIGEPLLNHANLRRALVAIRRDFRVGARSTTVSTVGFPSRLRRVARTAPPFQLAISLHSADDAERARLVPAMRDVPVAEVLAAGDDWFSATGREVTYEVALLAGTNDTPAHARRLAKRLAGRRATVNLIPYNPVREAPFGRPRRETVAAFRDTLRAQGIVATVRWSRGVESDAACGQLRVARSRP